MSESRTKGENDFKSETKYKQFSTAVEKALKTFEGLTEWHDLISCLARTNKVLLAYTQYPVVPLQLTVCKRLTQCLHPNLPSGVHLKTLDVYATIFERIGPKGLLSHLLLYSSGLFPLLSYASMSVRPRLLEIYEKYFLPLGNELLPTLHGFVLGLLPGLEDESEHTDRICRLLDALCDTTDKPSFFSALWLSILGSPDYRLPAVNFLLTKLNKKLSAEDQVHCVGGNLPLVVSSVCAALMDRNVLVQRGALDVVSILFPFHQSFLLLSDLTSVLSAALHTLLKRDVSLSRRLYVWLLGSQVLKSSLVAHVRFPSNSGDSAASDSEATNHASSAPSAIDVSYFEKYSKSYLILALKGILEHAKEASRQSLSKTECVLPYRLLRALLDRPEISIAVIDNIMPELVLCLKEQIEGLGGVPTVHHHHGHHGNKEGSSHASKPKVSLVGDGSSKKSGKRSSLRADIIQSANLLFTSLTQHFVWQWVAKMLEKCSSGEGAVSGGSDESGEQLAGVGSSEDRRQFTPVSEFLEGSSSVRDWKESWLLRSASSAGEREESIGGGGSGGDRPLTLRTLLAMFMFLMQVIPRDASQDAHVQHVSRLLLQVVSVLKSRHASLSLREVDSCHRICLHLLRQLLQTSGPLSQPFSLASTPSSSPYPSFPSTPTPPPSAVGSLADATSEYRSLGQAASNEEDNFELSYGDRILCIYDDYLMFFSEFLHSKVTQSSSESCKDIQKEDLYGVFTNVCDTVILMTKLTMQFDVMSTSADGDEQPLAVPSPFPWLENLMRVCQERDKPHLALTALETLLLLVEMAVSHAQEAARRGVGGGGGGGVGVIPTLSPVVACRVVTPKMVEKVVLTHQFVKVVTEHLWSLLSCGGSALHVQVVSVLAWLHSLLTSHAACEMVILEQFASQGLGAFNVFMILWKYLPTVYHNTKIKPFYRAVLRMLEGLQSSDSAVRSLTQSWVRTAVTEGGSEGTHRLLQPLVKILLESDTKRKRREDRLAGKKITLTRKEAEKDKKYAEYYFKSLGIANPYLASSRDQYVETVQHYTQAFDTNQILYALSLLQLAVQVDPFHLICNMGDTVIDVSAYMLLFGPPPTESPTTPTTPSSPTMPSLNTSHKSLLEVVLSTCVDLLCSEFHSSLKVSTEEQVENVKVKIGSASLLSVLLDELLKVLCKPNGSQTDDSASVKFKVCSPNFVSALLTLCDIQKVSLLLLGKSVEWWLDFSTPFPSSSSSGRQGKGVWREMARQWELGDSEHSFCENPSVVLSAFYSHLLRLVQCLISLDTRFSHSLPILTSAPQTLSIDNVTILSGVAVSEGKLLPPVSPGCATASQPYFRELLLQVLSSSRLSTAEFHDNLLHMFTCSLPNMLSQQVTDLAPRVAKQLCKCIEGTVRRARGGGVAAGELGCGSSKDSTTPSDTQLCVLYFDAILSTTVWCFFGDQSHPLQKGEGPQMGVAVSAHHHLKLHHRSYNPFFLLTRVKQAESSRETFSPMNKQPSTMAWLLGVFTAQKITSGGGAESEGGTGEGGMSRVGVDSQVGQQVSMLLPAIYNSMTDMWVELCSSAEEGGGRDNEGVVSSGEFMESSSLKRHKMVFEDVELLFGHFLCTLAEREPVALFSSISQVWLEWNLDEKIESRTRVSWRKNAFIDILHHIKVLPLHVLISCVHTTLNDMGKMEEYESSILRQKYLLHFLYKYMSSTRQSSKELSECRAAVISFLRDYHHQVYNPTPQGLLGTCHTLCMLTSILHVLVCRVAPPDIKTQKKERKELQEVTHKLCETLSMVANIGVTHPEYVLVAMASTSGDTTSSNNSKTPGSHTHSKREGEVGMVEAVEDVPVSGNAGGKGSDGGVASSEEQTSVVGEEGQEGGGGVRGGEEAGRTEMKQNGDIGKRKTQEKGSLDKSGGESASEELLQPTIQALAVLSNVLAHFIDCVFGGSEKDKVTALLKSVLFNIWPHLHSHSVAHRQCYFHCSKLLASLSGFQVTRKSWRKEVFDLFLSPDFFVMDLASLREWKVVVDNLMTQDQVTFRDLLNRLHSTTASGVVNLFSSLDQEILSGTILLKRMAFALFSGEVDQYVKFLPDIQEKLSEYLKVLRYPSICCEVLLAFRVLLLKFSPHHLMAFWPAMTAELIALLAQLELDICPEGMESSQSSHSNQSNQPVSKAKLQLYLSACKLLDTALALPPESLPHFQWLQWGFVSPGVFLDSDALVVARLCKHFRQVEVKHSPKNERHSRFHSPPYLRSSTIGSFKDLKPFFDGLRVGKVVSSQATTTTGASIHSNHDVAFHSSVLSKVSLVETVILQDFLESSA